MSTTGADGIRIQLNGSTRAVAAGLGLPALIESLGLPLQGALVEHNGRALLRSEWNDVVIAAEDRLEILRIVAGG